MLWHVAQRACNQRYNQRAASADGVMRRANRGAQQRTRTTAHVWLLQKTPVRRRIKQEPAIDGTGFNERMHKESGI